MKTKMTATIFLIGALLATALITGLYYGYSCSVNPGLGQLADRDYVAAMQSVNTAILNPLFFASFFGALLLLPVSACLSEHSLQSGRFVLLLSATAVYAFGSFGVTVFGNVPLNDALAAFDLQTASPAEIGQARQLFESSWNRLHSIRTMASFVALVLVVLAAFRE
jgi:uncharacterized membrane protein